MNFKVVITMFLIFTGFTARLILAQNEEKIVLSFENVKLGGLPNGWKVEGTNQRGPLATWEVTKDKTAPSGEKTLTLISPNHHFGGAFNLCWTKNILFKNGAISVMFKANKGEEDEGGGIIWRAKDKGNYYVARYNPLENNFRVYYVKNEVRKILASARVKLPAGKWHKMKIICDGNKIQGFLNGRKYLEVKNGVFPEAGGVGLWTKADAATSFDDFTVIKRK